MSSPTLPGQQARHCLPLGGSPLALFSLLCHRAWSLPLHGKAPYQGCLAKVKGWFSVLILFNLWAALTLDDDPLVLEALV